MSIQVQFRRGSNTQSDAFTGALGEITVDTTNRTIRVHDGTTLGGTTLAKKVELDSSFTQANAAFDTANNEAGVNATQNTNITNATNIATGAFDTANNEAGVNATQNTNITTATNIATGAFIQANAAFDRANTANTLAEQASNDAVVLVLAFS
jgi:hypothetical protein